MVLLHKIPHMLFPLWQAENKIFALTPNVEAFDVDLD
jgi:hypothetical protein